MNPKDKMLAKHMTAGVEPKPKAKVKPKAKAKAK